MYKVREHDLISFISHRISFILGYILALWLTPASLNAQEYMNIEVAGAGIDIESSLVLDAFDIGIFHRTGVGLSIKAISMHLLKNRRDYPDCIEHNATISLSYLFKSYETIYDNIYGGIYSSLSYSPKSVLEYYISEEKINSSTFSLSITAVLPTTWGNGRVRVRTEIGYRSVDGFSSLSGFYAQFSFGVGAISSF